MLEFSKPPTGSLQARPIALEEFAGIYFWTWINQNWYFGEEHTDKDWELIDTPSHDDFLIVCSQLSLVLEQMNAEGKTGCYFVHQNDLRFAFECPVLLCFQAPVTQPPKRPTDMSIGTHAVVLTTSPRLYTLDQLGDAGQEIHTRVRQGTQLIPLRTRRQRGTDWEREAELQILKNELWVQAQAAAKQLALLYWQFHQEQLLTPISRTPPKVPNVFNSGRTPIIAPLAVQGVLGAYSNAQSGARGWKNTAEKPYYQFSQGKDMARIEFRPPAASTEVVSPDIALQSLWQQIAKFSDLDGDVFLAMLAQWTAAAREADGSVWITNEKILEYRGIQPRQHENSDGAIQFTDQRLDDLQDIATSVERIRDTHVTTLQWVKEERAPGKRGRSKKRQLELESYIILIEEFIRQRDLPSPTDLDQAGLSIAWRFRLGNVLEMFFDEPNRQIAWLLQKALSYDYYHEMWEKRLARYCTFHMRINPGHGGVSIIRRVGDIFDELSLPTNGSDPEKTRKRFEKALDRLLEDRQISAWSYQEDFEELPSRKWLPIWLEYHIQLAADPLPPLEELSQEALE